LKFNRYGDLTIDSEECSKFEGTGGKNRTQNQLLSSSSASGLPSRDIKLFFLRNQVCLALNHRFLLPMQNLQVARARTDDDRAAAAAALQSEVDFRQSIDAR